jgi:ABC transport system ATP-binding/permease protein
MDWCRPLAGWCGNPARKVILLIIDRGAEGDGNPGARMTGDHGRRIGGPTVQARSVSLWRRGEVELRDITVSLRPGTLVGITGIGSSGISTLLAVLGGVTAPDAGVVRVGDTDLYAGPAADEVNPPLGFVPRFVDFPRDLTVRDALQHVPVTAGRDIARISSFTRRVWRPVKGRDRRRGTVDMPSPERVDEVLAEMGLTDAAQAKMRDLQPYDQTLVLVAAALLGDPHWLFADEPTFGLMPEPAGRMAALLRSFAGGTRGVVFTTHYLGDLQQCDQMLALAQDGHLAYSGPPAAAPAHFGVTEFRGIFNVR